MNAQTGVPIGTPVLVSDPRVVDGVPPAPGMFRNYR